MSKRCELQKEYYKEYGNYKGSGKYTDHYVKWLESEILALRINGVVKSSYCECDAPIIRTSVNMDEYCGYCGEDIKQ